MQLLRYGRPVGTIFDLMGSKEDDMTYSLGYVASRSPAFAASLLRHVAGGEVAGSAEGVVRLQTVAEDHGRTERRYFFPTEGGGWPEPPHYIAFRYDAR